MTYTLGSPLVINRKTLTGSINVQDQTQVINGTLQISSFAGSIINLHNGLVLTGLAGTRHSGQPGRRQPDRERYDLRAEQRLQYIERDTTSISACSGTQPFTVLSTSGSLGIFAQSGGTNNISQNLYLGTIRSTTAPTC